MRRLGMSVFLRLFCAEDMQFDYVILKLRQSLVAFSILGSKDYMDLGITSWLPTSNHEIMKGVVDRFIGEDIELLVLQNTKHNARRSDATMANDAYRCLGISRIR